MKQFPVRTSPHGESGTPASCRLFPSEPSTPVKRLRPGLALAAAALLAAASVAGADLYSVTDLGILNDVPGRTDAAVGGINNSGKVTVGSATNGAYAALVFGGAWTNLGTLGGSDSFGFGLNDSLSVVGRSLNATNLVRAFLWTPAATDGVPGNPQMKDLGTLGGASSEAFAVNSSGQVAGFAENDKNDFRAFRYSSGSLTDIGALLGNKYSYSYGYGINDSGHIAGEALNASWMRTAFLYDGVTAADIGTLPGGQYASAQALNNADKVVGYSDTAAGFEHAFRYAQGGMADLGTLGGNNSYANAINNNDVIVGVAGIDPLNDSLNHAFVYTGGTMVDLNTVLDASGTGWNLVDARDINDAGQIVGIGVYAGAAHVVLLNPLPQVIQQPTNLTVTCQSSAAFTVTAGPLPLACQWYHGNSPNGYPITGETNLTLTIASATGLQSGAYYAVVANALGSVTTAVATLNVLDSVPPVLSGCPGSQTNYVASGTFNTAVTWSNPIATDACDGIVPVSSNPTNGAVFPLGVTPVTCHATDSSGNTASCTFSITVVQVEPPVITGIEVQGGNVLLSFTTQSGASYAVDYRDSPTTGAWTAIMTGIPGSGEIVTASNFDTATASNRLYRVRLALP